MEKTVNYLGVRYRVLALGPEHPRCILIPSVDKKTGHVSVVLADLLLGEPFPCMRLTEDYTQMALPEDVNHLSPAGAGLLRYLVDADVVSVAGEACGRPLYAWNRSKMLAGSVSDPDAKPDRILSDALTALKGLRTGGYAPYVCNGSSSVEVQLRKTLDSAITLLEIAADLDAGLYRNV